MAITQGLLTRNVVRKDRVLLLSANLYTELRLDAAIGRGDVDRLLSMRSFLQTEKISADEIKAIKDRLYTNCAPDVPRWPAEAASYAKASAIMLAISVVLELVLRGASVSSQVRDHRTRLCRSIRRLTADDHRCWRCRLSTEFSE